MEPGTRSFDGTSDLLALFNGEAAGLVIIFDQASLVVSNVVVGPAAAPRASSPPGVPFQDIVRGCPAEEDLVAAAQAALQGVQREVEVHRIVAGRDHWVRLNVLPRFRGPARQRGFILIGRDVSSERRAAAELEAARDRLSAILEHAADAVLLIDTRGCIEDANRAVVSLFGWPVEDLVGKPVTELMDEPYRSSHAGWINSYLTKGVSGILNVGPRLLPARRRDGTPVPIELSIGEAWIGGERQFIGVCRGVGERLRQEENLRRANDALASKVRDLEVLSADLESRKQASEAMALATEAARRRAEESSLAKSRFLAKASHELRTPLNGVLAVADVLAAKDMPEEARELVGIISRSGRELADLLNEILDLSSLEMGGVTLHARPFSLSEMVGRLGGVWATAAKAKGLEFVLSVPEEPPPLLGDPVRLRQVLSNLLSNAVKFTQSGCVALEVTAEDAEGDHVALRFVVTDTGPGMDESARARLFEPFAQGASEAAQRHAGAGLGLSICRELVDLMGGAIHAESAPVGACMVVALELPRASEAVAAAAPSTAPEDLGDPLVLVAEDHPVNRQVMGVLLDQLGVRHEFAEDGAAALEAARAKRFDLILMDLQMPRMDGGAACAAIRRLPGEAGRVPIVAVTATSADPAVLDAGFDGYLGKPILPAALAKAIHAALFRPEAVAG